jgi:hypothetical protein
MLPETFCGPEHWQRWRLQLQGATQYPEVQSPSRSVRFAIANCSPRNGVQVGLFISASEKTAGSLSSAGKAGRSPHSDLSTGNCENDSIIMSAPTPGVDFGGTNRPQGPRERSRGCDYHPGSQQIAFVDTETGEFQERRLAHREEAGKLYRELAGQGMKMRVGMEASGHARWFERLLAELSFELDGRRGQDQREARTQELKTDREGRAAYFEAPTEG